MPNNTSIVEEQTTETNKPAQITRPSWDEWFMTLCFFIGEKSKDPRTHHGTILVGKDHSILSVGYNNPAKGANDEVASTLVNKPLYMIHSEQCAIINAAKNGVSTSGCTAYITGYPCNICLGSLINAGCVEIIHGPITSMCIESDEKIKEAISNLIEWSGIKIRSIDNIDFISHSISKLYQYLDTKLVKIEKIN